MPLDAVHLALGGSFENSTARSSDRSATRHQSDGENSVVHPAHSDILGRSDLGEPIFQIGSSY
jgi:hypothetical protein